ncbi:MAG: chemotaxis response regulator protein-glutamate methylesterase [Bacteriovorax sp.]|nr:chemotaxis response regulator protein-glutamate methylesterase [Bacteriovorax sp.]
MNKLNSKDLVTKKSGGEYLIELIYGDAFVSFQLSDGNCLGFYLKKTDLKKMILDLLFIKMTNYLPHSELICAEVKMIGMTSSLNLLEDYFVEKKFKSIKKIEKNCVIEVMFLPVVNKVRVSKEVAQTIILKSSPAKFKILIVDDSRTIRNILSRIFSSDQGLEVCAMAERPSEVEALILKHKPDVITLDIHMPEMDGVALLKIIGPKYNIPTVMISSISMAEGPMVLEALENGAIDYIQKPELSEIESVTPLIIEKVRTAAKANLSKSSRNLRSKTVQTTALCDLNSLIVLGSSTGGTEAIREIITALPDQIPPMLIVQHIPAVFSAAFAKRMNDLCPFEVKEAENGDEVRANRILIAPGGQQMKCVYKNGKAIVEINDDEPVNRFKPSVDYLFTSVAKNLYTSTIAVILTGMGKDGARGMLELRSLGVRTIAQDEFSSVVFGMPKEAIALGGAEFVEPLSDIAERITLLTKEKSSLKKIS